MTFQAWKIPFLNSMTFPDAWEPTVKAKDLTVKSLALAVKDLTAKAKDLPVKAKYVKPVVSSHDVRAKDIHC